MTVDIRTPIDTAKKPLPLVKSEYPGAKSTAVCACYGKGDSYEKCDSDHTVQSDFRFDLVTDSCDRVIEESPIETDAGIKKRVKDIEEERYKRVDEKIGKTPEKSTGH